MCASFKRFLDILSVLAMQMLLSMECCIFCGIIDRNHFVLCDVCISCSVIIIYSVVKFIPPESRTSVSSYIPPKVKLVEKVVHKALVCRIQCVT